MEAGSETAPLMQSAPTTHALLAPTAEAESNESVSKVLEPAIVSRASGGAQGQQADLLLQPPAPAAKASAPQASAPQSCAQAAADASTPGTGSCASPCTAAVKSQQPVGMATNSAQSPSSMLSPAAPAMRGAKDGTGAKDATDAPAPTIAAPVLVQASSPASVEVARPVALSVAPTDEQGAGADAAGAGGLEGSTDQAATHPPTQDAVAATTVGTQDAAAKTIEVGAPAEVAPTAAPARAAVVPSALTPPPLMAAGRQGDGRVGASVAALNVTAAEASSPTCTRVPVAPLPPSPPPRHWATTRPPHGRGPPAGLRAILAAPSVPAVPSVLAGPIATSAMEHGSPPAVCGASCAGVELDQMEC